MKKTVILTLLSGSILLFANCHQKAYPTDSGKNKTATTTTNTAAASADAQRVQGKMIFDQNCNKCHDLPKPGEYDMKAWDDILPKMISKANLADDKGTMVRAYVSANAKAG